MGLWGGKGLESTQQSCPATAWGRSQAEWHGAFQQECRPSQIHSRVREQGQGFRASLSQARDSGAQKVLQESPLAQPLDHKTPFVPQQNRERVSTLQGRKLRLTEESLHPLKSEGQECKAGPEA